MLLLIGGVLYVAGVIAYCSWVLSLREIKATLISWAGFVLVVTTCGGLAIRFGIVKVDWWNGAYAQHLLFGVGFPVFTSLIFASVLHRKPSGFFRFRAARQIPGFVLLTLLPSVVWETLQCFYLYLPSWLSRTMYAAEPGRFQIDQVLFEVVGLSIFLGVNRAMK